MSGIGGNSKAFELLTELNDTERGNVVDETEIDPLSQSLKELGDKL